MIHRVMSVSRANVFWFLIDGLSPDFLKSCGNNALTNTFFDTLIEKSFVFTNVASTAAGTHTAMHSVFSSMYPSVNGVSGWNIKALRNFNPDIFTLTDFFKLNDYCTFRYGDAAGERDVPKSGFDVWESSGVPIAELLKKTDNTDNERRRNFIKRVNECNAPKFVYHHCLILHELNGRLGNVWPYEDYVRNINKSADVFKKIYEAYNISKDDIVIISSDHGVILDKDWIIDGDVNGERHYEQSVKTFFSVSGEDIARGRFDGLVSSLDEAPTIADIVLGVDMPGQGTSRYSTMVNGIFFPSAVFREKGTYCSKTYTNSLSSDVYYVRQDNWKYVYGVEDERCEWLINLDEGDYCINHKDDEERIHFFKKMILDTFWNCQNGVKEIYDSKGFGLSKANQNVKFTIIVDSNILSNEVYDSLIDLGGPYYEILVLNTKELFPRFNVRSVSGGIENLSEGDINGEIVVFLNKKCAYSEYLLSDLNILFEDEKNDTILSFQTGFAVRKRCFDKRKELPSRNIAIRETDDNVEQCCFRRTLNVIKNLIKPSGITIDFYLIDSFEIFHFLPFYNAFRDAGFDAKFIAEPCRRNTAKNWFDYSNAIDILERKFLLFLEKPREKADIAFTTQDAYLLKKYSYKTKKINLSYGFSFKKDYFIHSKRTTEGFDYRFVHGDIQKEMLSKFMDEKRILKVGYPKYANRFGKLSRDAVLNELNIKTQKPILVYFPTWDEDNTIRTYYDEIKKLHNDYYVISKAHHCTTLAKNPDDYKALYEMSDCVLDGNYDFGKAALIGDVVIADAKSGASFEVAYINNSVPIALLLKSEEEKEKYNDEMRECFSVINSSKQLRETINKLKNGDKHIAYRNNIVDKCLGLKNYDYMSIVLEFIRRIVKNNGG